MLLPRYRRSLFNIVQLFDDRQYSSDLELTNNIRNWVNTNSVHLIDEEHDSYAFDVPQVTEKLWQRSAGEIRSPHLSCGPRAYAMKEIVDAMGVQSRIIDIFAITDRVIRSHTLLEVFDRQQQLWIMQDPDFNVVYKYDDHRILSALELVRSNKSEVTYSAGGFSIENEINCINTIKSLFELGVLYRESYIGQKSLLLWNQMNMSNEILDGGNGYTISKYFYGRDFNPKIEFHRFEDEQCH